MARKLSGNVLVTGTDAEDFGSDEHPSDGSRPIDMAMFPKPGPYWHWDRTSSLGWRV